MWLAERLDCDFSVVQEPVAQGVRETRRDGGLFEARADWKEERRSGGKGGVGAIA